ncbi:hypothetical protein H0H87_003539 [Tephrocybe sp. NHM501043]|nr:hypothetical protein H0H87_003539 [Tephrocybe sp. NHM501043]
MYLPSEAEKIQIGAAENNSRQPVLSLMELDTETPEEMNSILPKSVLDTDSDGMAVEAAFHNALDDSDDSDPDYTGEVEAQESEEDEGDVEDASSNAPVPKKKVNRFSSKHILLMLLNRRLLASTRSLRQVINGTRDHPRHKKSIQYKRKVVENADSDR